jgi:hypothetical protein
LEEEVRLSEISCLRVLGFLLAYIIEFLLTYVRGFHPILESPITINGKKYYKAKDFVSSKCHKEMKDTWIASL